MVVIRKNNFKFFQAQIILLNRSHFFTEFDFGYTRRNLLKFNLFWCIIWIIKKLDSSAEFI